MLNIHKSKSTKPKSTKSILTSPGVNTFIVLLGVCKYVFKDAVETCGGWERDSCFDSLVTGHIKDPISSKSCWTQKSPAVSSSGPSSADCFVDCRTGIEALFDDLHTQIWKETSSSFDSQTSSTPTVRFRGGESIGDPSDTRFGSSGWSQKNVVSLYAKSCNNISNLKF